MVQRKPRRTQSLPNHSHHVLSRPIRSKIKANSELASARFPALGTGCMFSPRVLIGSSFNLRLL